MFMQYLGGAPGHLRRHMSTPTCFVGMDTDAELASAAEDPTAVECRIVLDATWSQPSQEQIEDEVDDWYAPEDEAEIELDEDEFQAGEDRPDDDELSYALAGLTLP